jgi:predicted ATP-binding protein involved in virulence
MQFIASTHSPFIIQSLRPEDGFVFNLDHLKKKENPVQNEHYNNSIEDIAEEIQSVENPCRSALHNDLFRVSKDYYQKLDELGQKPKDAEAKRLRQELDQLMEKAATDPAVAAFLAFRREAAGIDK